MQSRTADRGRLGGADDLGRRSGDKECVCRERRNKTSEQRCKKALGNNDDLLFLVGMADLSRAMEPDQRIAHWPTISCLQSGGSGLLKA